MEQRLQFRIKEHIYNQPIEMLELNTRSQNCLKRYHLNTIGDVLDNQHRLLELRNCGVGCVTEIKNKILEYAIADACREEAM